MVVKDKELAKDKMMDYGTQLRKMGLDEVVVCTILCGWDCDSIEALLRGELEAPSFASVDSGIRSLASLD